MTASPSPALSVNLNLRDLAEVAQASLVGTTVTAGTVEVTTDACATSARSLKLRLTDKAGEGDAVIKNYLVKNTNYTVTLANVPTPVGATGQWGQVRVSVGERAKGGMA
jgi:hypothetical protein